MTLTTEVRVEGASVHVLATVHGLASEEERARAAFAAVSPRALAIGLSPEAVAGILHHLRERERLAREPPPPPPPRPAVPRRHKDGTLVEEDVDDPYEYEAEDLLTDSEAVYGLALQRYGKVRLPPRELTAAIVLAQAAKIPFFGVDFPEEEYAEVFTSNVTTWALLRYTRRTRKLEKRPPEAATARDFALAWDAALRKVRGYDAVEKARERRIAEAATVLARQHGRVLLLVEAAREAGVVAALRAPATPDAKAP